jgi:peroxiredoxin Q/BCP
MPSSAEVGDAAPDFTLSSTHGDITLAERWPRNAVLLVFYPGDDTFVCTRQLCDYRDHFGVFADLGVDLLGINPQDLDSHRAFAEKHALPFPLLCDSDGSVCRAYGALGWLGTARRALVLIGMDGRIRWKHSDLPIFHRGASELADVISRLDDEDAQ